MKFDQSYIEKMFEGALAVLSIPSNTLYMFNSNDTDKWDIINSLHLHVTKVPFEHYEKKYEAYVAHGVILSKVEYINLWIWDEDEMDKVPTDEIIMIFPQDYECASSGLEGCGCNTYVHEYRKIHDDRNILKIGHVCALSNFGYSVAHGCIDCIYEYNRESGEVTVKL